MKFITLRENVKILIKKRKWFVLTIVILVCLVGVGIPLGINYLKSSQTKAASATASGYQTATARQGSIRVSITGSGVLEANHTQDLSFSTTGIVGALDVEVGSVVKKGQVMASLEDAPTLEANVANANLTYIQAKQDLDELYANAKVTLAQAYENWVTAKGEYETALTNADRMSNPRCNNEVNARNSANVDRAKSRLDSTAYGTDSWIEAENNYETALANYTYCISYTDEEKVLANAAADVKKAALDKADSVYQALKIGSGIDPDTLALAQAKVDQAKADLDQAQTTLAGIKLIADIDGVVTYFQVNQGVMVGTEKFITISDLSQLEVAVSIDETDIAKFNIGSKAEIVFDAFPDQTFNGEVSEVSPELTSTLMTKVGTGTVILDDQATAFLKSSPLGLNASVEVISEEAKDVILIPVEALMDLGGGEFAVFVVGTDGQLRLKTVEVGLNDGTYAEIKSNLAQGDIVSTGLVSTK